MIQYLQSFHTASALLVLLFVQMSLSAQDPVVVTISDTELDELYYHQEVFDEPTKLVFSNLTQVNGYAYFHQNENLVGLEFPVLSSIGDYLYIHENLELEIFMAPQLTSVTESIYFGGNSAISSLDICALQEILPFVEEDFEPMWPDGIPNYYFNGNSSEVDDNDPCFSLGAPENLELSNLTVSENQEIGVEIGSLSADSNYPNGSLTFYLTDWEYQDDFFIEGNTLYTNSSFDFEIQSNYEIGIGVFNQLGEVVEGMFEIEVEDVSSEDIQVITITDEVLDSIYYFNYDFAVPTRLEFVNLHTVEGYVIFYKCNNLVGINFPKLTYSDLYLYVDGNESLTTFTAPIWETIHNDVYIAKNINLVELDLCGLKEILPSIDDEGDWYMVPYYCIEDNTPEVDLDTMCFSLGGPTDLALSGNVVSENQEVGSVIGELSANTNYPEGSLTYYLRQSEFDNQYFSIEGSELVTSSVFDFEGQSSYEVEVGVFNQLGESATEFFTIEIEDVSEEGFQVIEISDVTMENIYYHQKSFIVPTKLVFTNLTTVNGYVYFHENINLVEVELPQLLTTGEYVYFHGNAALESVSAPMTHTVHSYLYASNHAVLTEFDFCALENILPIADPDFPVEQEVPYYYVEGNDLLNEESLCFDLSSVEYVEEESLTEEDNTLAGEFKSSEGEPLLLSFVDEYGEEIERNDLLIVENKIYLTFPIDEYSSIFSVEMIARIDHNTDNTSGLYQLIEQQSITIDLNKDIVSGVEENGLSLNYSLYPNPALDFVTVDVPQKTTLSVYSSNGQLVNELKMEAGANVLDFSQYEAGLYFLQPLGMGATRFIKE